MTINLVYPIAYLIGFAYCFYLIRKAELNGIAWNPLIIKIICCLLWPAIYFILIYDFFKRSKK